MLMRLMDQMNSGRRPPTHMAIFFDPSRDGTWRKKVFPAYKADRPETPAELKAQIPVMQQVCTQIGIPWAISMGYEADDLIAAYANDAADEGSFVSILSGDKDLMQLVRTNVLQYNDLTKKGYKLSDVEEKFGVPAHLVGDFLAMAGDSADGVPGVRGIGPVYAARLLVEYGSLEAMIEDPEIIENKGLRKKMQDSVEEARMSRRLTVLTGEGVPRPLSREEIQKTPDAEMRSRTIDWLRSKTD